MITTSDRHEVGRILLGARLRERRVEAGLTLASLASQADVSVSYLSDVERARRLPALDKLDALAQALGTDVAELLGDVYPWGTALAPQSVVLLPDGRERGRGRS